MINLTDHLRNCVSVTEEAEGYIYPNRFYPGQYAHYSKDAMAEALSKSTAGVVIGFLTDGDTVTLQCKRGSILRFFLPALHQTKLSEVNETLHKLALMKKPSVRVVSDGIDLVVDGELRETYRPKSGRNIFRFDNPYKDFREVKLYLPALFGISVRDLSVNGNIMPLPKKRRMLCLGDSITQGFISGSPFRNYVSRVAELLEADAINQGVGGYTYQQGSLCELERMEKPDLITVAYGTNDWFYNPEIDDIQKNIREYYARLNELFPEVSTYAMTPLWRADLDMPHASNVPLCRIGEIIREETAKYGNIKVIDCEELIPHDSDYFADGFLHPNGEGYAFMAMALAKKMIADSI